MPLLDCDLLLKIRVFFFQLTHCSFQSLYENYCHCLRSRVKHKFAYWSPFRFLFNWFQDGRLYILLKLWKVSNVDKIWDGNVLKKSTNKHLDGESSTKNLDPNTRPKIKDNTCTYFWLPIWFVRHIWTRLKIIIIFITFIFLTPHNMQF